MTTWADDAAAALEALGDSPTPEQARAVTDRYPNVDVLAALASASGGGGGLPAWFMSGEGTPVDITTPSQTGAIYVDLTNGTIYVAMGATDTDWIALGYVAGNIGESTGLVFANDDRDLYVLAGERDAHPGAIYIGHAYNQWNGHGQGILWTNGAEEGDETLQVKTGATGEWVGTLQDTLGNIRPANTIDATNIPTSNPGPNMVYIDEATRVLKVG